MTTYYVTTSGSDSNAGTSEGAAFATLGKAGSVALTSGDIVYVKSGTYVLGSDTPDVAGGVAVIREGVSVYGYESTIGDNCPTGNRPVLDASGFSSFTNNVGLINYTGPNYSADYIKVKNLRLLGVLNIGGSTAKPRSGFSGTGSWGAGAGDEGHNVYIENCEIEGFFYAIEANFVTTAPQRSVLNNCYINDNVLTFQDAGIIKNCHVRNWYRFGGFDQFTDSLVEFIGDGANAGFNGGIIGANIIGCVIVNTNGNALTWGLESSGYATDNIVIGFPVAYKLSSTNYTHFSRKCYAYGETTLVDYSGQGGAQEYLNLDITSLTENPFVDPINLNFTLKDSESARQELGGLATLRDGIARGLVWYRKPSQGVKSHPLDF